jgi:predicted PurR-regulated permease PerM
VTPNEDRERVRRMVLIGLASGITLLFLWMIREFLLALLLSALLAGLLYPLNRRLRHRLGGRKGAAAALIVAVLALVAIGPLAGLLALAWLAMVATRSPSNVEKQSCVTRPDFQLCLTL